ncbi:MAG: acyl-CoA dehydrogenase [Sphingomonadales bacterium]|nr:MAG: acyl-CoA dehydrogenase [Sphingomonadales bacterium]
MIPVDEESLIRASVRGFAAEYFPLEANRRALDEAATFDRPTWRAMAEQGWLGMSIAEEFGGLGLPVTNLCIVAEEMGRALAPVPFCATLGLFAPAIAHAGTPEQQAHWLPRIAAGEVTGAVAISEGPGAATGQKLRTRHAGGAIKGTKLPVLDGMAADAAIVLARDGRSESLFIVDLRKQGIERETLETIDPSRPAATLRFDGAKAERLGAAGTGAELLEYLLARAAVPLAFEQIGGAQRCLEMAVEYARDRYAFGRAIGSFQAIKHKLADLYLRIEVARLNAHHAASVLDQNAPDLPLAAAAARVSACDAYWMAAKENIHVHGGIGFTWEMDCHLFYRRSKLLAVTSGPATEWKARIAAHLLEEAA